MNTKYIYNLISNANKAVLVIAVASLLAHAGRKRERVGFARAVRPDDEVRDHDFAHTYILVHECTDR